MLSVYTTHIVIATYQRSASEVHRRRRALLLRQRIRDRCRPACLAHLPASSRMRSAAFSANISVGALILPEVTAGKTEASTTRRSATPCTRRRGSTTELVGVRTHRAGAARVEHRARRGGGSPRAPPRRSGRASPGASSDSITVGERLGGGNPAQHARSFVHIRDVLRRRQAVRRDRGLDSGIGGCAGARCRDWWAGRC